MVVEADKPGTVDLQRQVVVFAGNVVISAGHHGHPRRAGGVARDARRLPRRHRHRPARASRPATARSATASTSTSKALCRPHRVRRPADTLRLVGNGVVRRLRGSTVADEITGALITWDNNAELFSVQGGAATPATPAAACAPC
jgi:lipopolysaccharide export system protein LptA